MDLLSSMQNWALIRDLWMGLIWGKPWLNMEKSDVFKINNDDEDIEEPAIPFESDVLEKCTFWIFWIYKKWIHKFKLIYKFIYLFIKFIKTAFTWKDSFLSWVSTERSSNDVDWDMSRLRVFDPFELSTNKLSTESDFFFATMFEQLSDGL